MIGNNLLAEVAASFFTVYSEFHYSKERADDSSEIIIPTYCT
jgi:hypothetical protein